jgi:ribonuclease P protein component
MSLREPDIQNLHPAEPSAGFPLRLHVMTKRAQFLAAARAPRQATPGFVLQARKRDDGDDVRVGYTCSKKVGNAVARNRAKRRLRALARAVLPEAASPGMDYVLIGRSGVSATRDFAQMEHDLRRALVNLAP